jgi:hypothetical protein
MIRDPKVHVILGKRHLDLWWACPPLHLCVTALRRVRPLPALRPSLYVLHYIRIKAAEVLFFPRGPARPAPRLVDASATEGLKFSYVIHVEVC